MPTIEKLIYNRICDQHRKRYCGEMGTFPRSLYMVCMLGMHLIPLSSCGIPYYGTWDHLLTMAGKTNARRNWEFKESFLRSWFFISKRNKQMMISQEAKLLERMDKRRQKKFFFFRNCLLQYERDIWILYCCLNLALEYNFFLISLCS